MCHFSIPGGFNSRFSFRAGTVGAVPVSATQHLQAPISRQRIAVASGQGEAVRAPGSRGSLRGRASPPSQASSRRAGRPRQERRLGSCHISLGGSAAPGAPSGRAEQSWAEPEPRPGPAGGRRGSRGRRRFLRAQPPPPAARYLLLQMP